MAMTLQQIKEDKDLQEKLAKMPSVLRSKALRQALVSSVAQDPVRTATAQRLPPHLIPGQELRQAGILELIQPPHAEPGLGGMPLVAGAAGDPVDPSGQTGFLGTGIEGEELAAIGAELAATQLTGPLRAPALVRLLAIPAVAAGTAGGTMSLIKGKTPRDAASETFWQAYFTLPGFLLSSGPQQFFRPLAKSVGPKQETARRVFERVGGQLTLDQVTKSTFVQKLADNVESAFFVSKEFRDEYQIAKLRELWDQTIDGIRPNPLTRDAVLREAGDIADPLTRQTVGELFGTAKDTAISMGRVIRRERYADVWAKTGASSHGVGSLDNLIDSMGLEKIIDPLDPGNVRLTKYEKLRLVASRTGDTHIGALAEDTADLIDRYGDGFIPAEAMHDNIRANINEAIGLVGGPNTRAGRRLVIIKDALDKDFMPLINKSGARKEYDKAVAWMKTFEEKVQGPVEAVVTADMLKNAPEQVTNAIFEAPTVASRIKKLLRAPPPGIAPQPEVWDELVERKIRNSWIGSPGQGGAIERLSKDLPVEQRPINTLLQMDDDAINLVFNKGQVNELDNFAVTVAEVARRPKEGMLIQLAQAGQVVGLVMMAGAPVSRALGVEQAEAPLGVGGLFFIGAPPIMAKAFRSKVFVKALTEGLRTPISALHLIPSISTRIMENYIKAATGTGLNLILNTAGYPDVRLSPQDIGESGSLKDELTISSPSQQQVITGVKR